MTYSPHPHPYLTLPIPHDTSKTIKDPFVASSRDPFADKDTQIKTPQSALLSNHEVLLHLRQEDAEYTGADETGRKRKKPSGLTHILRDVRLQSPRLLFSSIRFAGTCETNKTNNDKGLAYLQTAEYTTSSLADTHPSRPRTLYRGPHSLFRALAPKYRLNKAEYLQLYNLRPTTQVTLELIVEEVCITYITCIRPCGWLSHFCFTVADMNDVNTGGNTVHGGRTT